MDRRSSKSLMEMLGLEDIEVVARASAVRWYGHVLRREEGNILRNALDFEVVGRRKRGRPKSTWKKKVQEEVKKIGLVEMDELDRATWRKGIRKMKRRNEVNPATSVNGENTG